MSMPVKHSSSPSPVRGTAALQLLVPAAFALLAACGGGAGGVTGSIASVAGASSLACAEGCGTALVTLTDADGDFTSYTVDVTAVTLKRADGAVVQVLPSKQRIDFAQLVNTSELLASLPVPRGEYVSGSITVDYTNAAIAVEVGGQSKTATVVDANGAAPGVVQLELQLDTANRVRIETGRRSRLALDFNLAASNTVDLAATPPKVTVKPFVVASVVPAENKDLRVRGGVASVDTAGSKYVVDVKPFREGSATSGQATVITTAQTTFEINGQSYTGAAGLTALAALPAGTMVAAFGTLTTTDQAFTATRVLAGSSLESSSQDGISGVVVARSGDRLTVRGATLSKHDGEDRFQSQDVTVVLGANTGVTRAGSSTALTSKDPSVGQRIVAFGTSSTDAAGATTVDATAGRVRLEPTFIWGTFKSSGAGVATIGLEAIEGRAPTAFNFAGTGASTAQDADPANYEVNTRTLSLTGIAAGGVVKFGGYVNPFGAAPPDFDAQAMVDFSNVATELRVSWKDEGSSKPFATLAASGIVIDLANAELGLKSALRTGPKVTDIKSLASNPTLVGSTASGALFAIRDDQAKAVKNFASFAEFVTELTTRTTAGAKVEDLWARGSYAAGSNTFTATQVAVHLE